MASSTATSGAMGPESKELKHDQTNDQSCKPLSGIRVLDLTQIVSGPFCTTLLANMGAEVVKIEPPGRGDDLRTVGHYAGREQHEDYFNANNNSKKSITLNLKDEVQRQVAHDLVQRADIVVENFAPGTAARLGMSWDDLRGINSRLLYCSISGFGQDGPYRDRTALDPIIQAVSGIMSVTGYPETDPVAVGAPLADVVAGLFAAYTIAASLHSVKETGRGHYIDISMQATMLAMLGPRMGGALNAGIAPKRMGNQNPMRTPCDVYHSRDGTKIFVIVHSDRQWAPFCRALGRHDWLEVPRFSSNRLRCENRDELNGLVFARFAEFDSDEITARLAAERIPYAVVNDYVEALNDPQVVHRNLVQEVEHKVSGPTRVIGPPWLIDGKRTRVQPPPTLGEHQDDVLRDWLGWTRAEVAGLCNGQLGGKP